MASRSVANRFIRSGPQVRRLPSHTTQIRRASTTITGIGFAYKRRALLILTTQTVSPTFGALLSTGYLLRDQPRRGIHHPGVAGHTQPGKPCLPEDVLE